MKGKPSHFPFPTVLMPHYICYHGKLVPSATLVPPCRVESWSKRIVNSVHSFVSLLGKVEIVECMCLFYFLLLKTKRRLIILFSFKFPQASDKLLHVLLRQPLFLFRNSSLVVLACTWILGGPGRGRDFRCMM